ncbi:MAG: hypothetical protein ACK52I_09660 [Pseudomonadota bacterium]|jgi:hypothetical protein
MIKKTVLANIILIGCVFSSCWQRQVKVNEIVGSYIFIYPSGEVETLSVEENLTYRKDIYAGFKDYEINSAPKYSNQGKWILIDKNELRFYDWLMYNELLNPDKVLSKPFVAIMNNVHWNNPTKTQKARISLYDESGYVFQKID